MRSVSDADQVKNALSLMQVYVNNIVKDPENPKYRKIRISELRVIRFVMVFIKMLLKSNCWRGGGEIRMCMYQRYLVSFL